MRNALLFILLSVSAFGFSQTGALGSPFLNEYAASVISDDAGNTYIGGSSEADLWIIKRNSLGATQWSRNLSFNGAVTRGDVTSLVKVGDTLFGSVLLHNSSGTTAGGAYFRMDAITGTCDWLKYDPSNNVYFSSVQYYQGKLVLSGSKALTTTTAFYDGKVIAVSSVTGNLLWETPLFGLKFTSNGADYIDDFMAATTIENGKMYLTGRSYVNGAPVNMRPTLIGIDVDDNGSIFLRKYLMYNIATDFSRVYGFAIKRDGPNELVIGFSGDYLCTGCTNNRSGIVKCDLNGNVIWSKYYDINGVTEEIIRGLNVTPDGYVLYGQVNAGAASKAFLLKTDKQGNFLLGKLVGQINTNICVRGAGVNMGGSSDFRNNVHHFTGNKYPTNSNLRDIFYLKADNSNLEGDNSCFIYENFTVNTVVIPPHSGNLTVTNSPYNLSLQSTFSQGNATSTTCPDITVNTTHSNGCVEDSITISVSGISNPQFTWSNGSTGSSVVATTPDTLFVSIHDPVTCCVYEEMIVPDFQPPSTNIDVELPADTTLCLNTGEALHVNALINSSQTGVNFTWNSGETTSGIDIDETGTYIVRAYVGCSEGFDTIKVTINHIPVLDLGPDLQLCISEMPFFIDPDISGIANWQWSTGETTPGISVSNYGSYGVTVSNTCGSDSDSISLSELGFPEITLIPFIDTCVPPGMPILLSAAVNGANSVLWNTGSADFEISVFQSGTYTIAATNNCGTVSESSLVLISHPYVDQIPGLITSCEGYIQLSEYVSSSFAVSSPEIDLSDNLIEESGWIYFTLETSCATYSDSALISINTLDLFYLQNSFTPNGDGINDRFESKTPDVAFTSVEIYDRWGERIYHEENGFHGWDGTFKGHKCPDGIYQVVVFYTDCHGLGVQFNGHVVLVR
ncbi:MAG: gliding motility-associated C-terminal domain-containing protein [Fluviicola sp.]